MRGPSKDAQFWDGHGRRRARAASTRDGAAGSAASARAGAGRWAASIGGALALAAAFALWVRAHHGTLGSDGGAVATRSTCFEDLEPGEMLEELAPDEIDRVAKAFNKGA